MMQPRLHLRLHLGGSDELLGFGRRAECRVRRRRPPRTDAGAAIPGVARSAPVFHDRSGLVRAGDRGDGDLGLRAAPAAHQTRDRAAPTCRREAPTGGEVPPRARRVRLRLVCGACGPSPLQHAVERPQGAPLHAAPRRVRDHTHPHVREPRAIRSRTSRAVRDGYVSLGGGARGGHRCDLRRVESQQSRNQRAVGRSSSRDTPFAPAPSRAVDDATQLRGDLHRLGPMLRHPHPEGHDTRRALRSSGRDRLVPATLSETPSSNSAGVPQRAESPRSSQPSRTHRCRSVVTFR